MAKNKRQHFVPQMHLRNFAVNDKKTLIGIYNIENEQYISAGPIKTQAYDDYFYGKNIEVENYITAIESNVNTIINEIVINNSLPDRKLPEFAYLIKYIATLTSRTEREVEALEEMSMNTINYTSRNKKEKDALVEEFELGKKMHGLSGRGAMSLFLGLQGGILLGDLEMKILEANKGDYFITSDNPVIMYNMFMENKDKIGSSVGFGTLGLQIFLPLNPNKCLMLYDSFIYKIGNKSKNIVKIFPKDVDNINKLQILNANNNIYFGNTISEKYINKLMDEVKEKRLKNKTEIDLYEVDKDNKFNLFRISKVDIKYGLKLSYGFLTELAGIIQIKKEVSYVRSKILLNKLREIFGEQSEKLNHVKIRDIDDILEEIKIQYKIRN